MSATLDVPAAGREVTLIARCPRCRGTETLTTRATVRQLGREPRLMVTLAHNTLDHICDKAALVADDDSRAEVA